MRTDDVCADEDNPDRARLRRMLASLETRYAWQPGEALVRILLFLAAAFAVLVTFAIALVLLGEALVFFGRVSPVEFLTGTLWSPDIPPFAFGVLPLVAGTVVVAGGAALIGIPLGLGSAIFLREYAPRRVREIVKPMLEILAGIPTVVFGFFGLLVISPALQDWFGADFFNGMTAILVIGILIVPLVSSLSEDALSAVPADLRDGALALGATRLEATARVVVPGAFSGILASALLAISRAVGETMVVLIVAGQNIDLELNPFHQMQTMSAFIARRASGDVAAGELAYQALFAVGVALFLMTLALNVLSDRLRTRFREVYE
jgi:phosphate transport system permease protein